MTDSPAPPPIEVPVELVVNGRRRRTRVEPRHTLADALRERLGLTGTHLGCEQGVCGACTVLVDGEPVRSCLVFAVQLEGAEVTTIEGLAGADGTLHPVQQAFTECHGLQCGFCTPGFVLTAVELLGRDPSPSRATIRHELSGNLCRCTGYVGIVDAVEQAAAALAGRDGRPEVELRPARPDDVDRVAAIWSSGWRDGHLGHVPEEVLGERTDASFRERTPGRVADTTVAVVDGAVAGFIMVVADEVEQVYVAADHRGLGVADVLLAEAERQVAAAGHRTAWLAVVAGNERARRFYHRQGWSDAGPVDYQASARGGSVTIPSHRYEKPLT